MSTAVARTPADGSAGSGAGGPAAANAIEASGTSVYRVILAWGTVITLLVLLSRTRAGYAFVYYSLALMLVFLVVTQYRFFSWVLAPITTGNTFKSNAGIQEPAPTHTESNPGVKEKAPLVNE